jgi:hypothetical protein
MFCSSSSHLLDPPGPTFLSYTPDGSKLVTVGIDNHLRVYEIDSDAEPVTIDECSDNNTAVAASVGWSLLHKVLERLC